MTRPSHALVSAFAIATVLTACAPDATEPIASTAAVVSQSPAYAKAGTSTGEGVSPELQKINAALAAAGAGYAVEMAEISFAPTASVDKAQIIYAFDRTLRLASKWVPGDVRRGADGVNITYMIDQSYMNASGAGDAESAIDASFGTWQHVSCSNLNIVKRPDDGNLNSAVLGYGNPFAADIETLGFLPGGLFDALLGPGASTNVLGVTFTFIFGSTVGGQFIPSDVDNNGRTDTALKEVWYNNAFSWTTSDAPGVDVETVALHENGHALELGHFGKVSVTTSNGKLHVSPRAVMNAFILGVLRTPLGTDNASYCGNFASWPG